MKAILIFLILSLSSVSSMEAYISSNQSIINKALDHFYPELKYFLSDVTIDRPIGVDFFLFGANTSKNNLKVKDLKPNSVSVLINEDETIKVIVKQVQAEITTELETKALFSTKGTLKAELSALTFTADLKTTGKWENPIQILNIESHFDSKITAIDNKLFSLFTKMHSVINLFMKTFVNKVSSFAAGIVINVLSLRFREYNFLRLKNDMRLKFDVLPSIQAKHLIVAFDLIFYKNHNLPENKNKGKGAILPVSESPVEAVFYDYLVRDTILVAINQGFGELRATSEMLSSIGFKLTTTDFDDVIPGIVEENGEKLLGFGIKACKDKARSNPVFEVVDGKFSLRVPVSFEILVEDKLYKVYSNNISLKGSLEVKDNLKIYLHVDYFRLEDFDSDEETNQEFARMFNMLVKMTLPVVNTHLKDFRLPIEELFGVDLEAVNLSSKDNYFDFSLSPRFITRQAEPFKLLILVIDAIKAILKEF